MWLTREETIWILPAVALVLPIAAFLEWRRGANRWGGRCLLLVSPLAILAVSLALVSVVNRHHYGAFIVTEVGSADWLAAYGALTRVEHDVPRRFMIAPRHVRERIYAVSPAFSELRASLEGDLGHRWMSFGCRQMPDKIGRASCREGW